MRINPDAVLRRRAGGRTLSAAIVLVASAWIAGCGDNPSQPKNDVNVSEAVPAAEQAASMQQVAASEAAIDEVETPLATAAGDIESLGDVGGGNTGLGDYGSLPKLIAASVSDLRVGIDLGEGATLAMQALGSVAGGPALAAVESCTTAPQPGGGSLRICRARTDTLDVWRISILRISPTGPVRRSEQVFYVDDGGTSAQRGDDRILSYWSLATFASGATIEVSMLPRQGQYIVDGSLVDVMERVRPAAGPVTMQANTMTFNVGLVAKNGDEVIWSLSSQVTYRNGSSATFSVSDRARNGIADEDTVDVTSQFTAAPSNQRLESTTGTLVLLVHVFANPKDDQVAQVSHTSVFDGRTAAGGSPTSTVSYTPSQPVGRGEEPCGGHFEKHATFPAGWEMQTCDLVIDRSCGQGGTSTLVVTYSDATRWQRTITWNSSGVATLAATRRDGSVVSGTFNAATRSFTIDTTYPAGNDPVSSHQEGVADPSAKTRDYLLVVTYQTHVDTLSVHGQVNADSTRTVSGYAVNPKGRVTFQMQIDPQTGTITGTAQGPQNQTLRYSLARQEDGCALFLFTYRDPAKLLTITGNIILNPDGSGCGTITITQGRQTTTKEICFKVDGRGWIQGLPGGEIRF